MPRLNAANNAASTLAVALTAGATSMTVADASSFPDAPFRVTIDAEIIEVGAINKSTGVLSSLLRGREGTAAVAHNAGAPVENRWTAGMYGELATEGYADDAAAGAASIVQANLNNHTADYVRHLGYAVTGGSGNAYTVTLSPAPSVYTDGMGIVIKADRDNTGASTLNVNGLGARAIKRPNGSDLAAGNIKNGSIYTLRYNATTENFILQGEGGDFNVGDTITDTRLLPVDGGMGTEIWAKTDVASGRGVAVDSAGNVYCAHFVISGKSIRKLDGNMYFQIM